MFLLGKLFYRYCHLIKSFVLNRYQVDKPTADDRSRFLEKLVEDILTLQVDESTSKLKKVTSLPELPKAPQEVSGPKPSELQAKAEAEQHALRRLRMCLRDVCNRSVSQFLTVQGMLSQMDPALVSFCDNIAAQGGPLLLADDVEELNVPTAPVVQLANVPRSAQLCNVQLDVNLVQSYEVIKLPKENTNHAGTWVLLFIIDALLGHVF
ncbi:hypothetical protein B296_00012787 [Ensete ventricosum]|uniref:Uncharacterized protein n=1 Tax=Ensete ventricosum TaxID=4639 RepID=A0A427A0X2_ENSVE|nr:hypothetical protein B296_00012787 [Ensete ventricosum]